MDSEAGLQAVQPWSSTVAPAGPSVQTASPVPAVGVVSRGGGALAAFLLALSGKSRVKPGEASACFPQNLPRGPAACVR